MNVLKVIGWGSSQKVSIFALQRCFHVSAALRDQPSFYDVLDIPRNSTQTEIRDAYYKLSKLYHPDIKKDENSLTMFRKITEAYDVLGNVRTRLEYDNKIFGKYQPYDTSKQEFYSTLYRDQCLHGVRRPEVNKVLDRKSIIDQFLSNEYKDRIAEYRTFKNKTYEHDRVEQTLDANFQLERSSFCLVVVSLYTLYKYSEHLGDF